MSTPATDEQVAEIERAAIIYDSVTAVETAALIARIRTDGEKIAELENGSRRRDEQHAKYARKLEFEIDRLRAELARTERVHPDKIIIVSPDAKQP